MHYRKFIEMPRLKSSESKIQTAGKEKCIIVAIKDFLFFQFPQKKTVKIWMNGLSFMLWNCFAQNDHTRRLPQIQYLICEIK